MTLSVIVPVKRDLRLGRCLDALARQSLERDRFEILVVDNGPDAFIRRLAKKFSVRYLTHVDGGSYAARAQGAQEAKGSVLVFTDADCVPPSDWLSTVDALFADPTCQVVIGPSSSMDHSAVSSWVQSIDESRRRCAG